MKEKITIEDLYSDVGLFDQEAVLLTLKGKVTFSKENEILFTIDPANLKTSRVVLMYALAKKVLKVNEKIDDELISAAEITDKMRLNRNTVGVAIMRLKNKKLLMPSGSGYEIPLFKVAEVIDSLNGNGD